MKKLFLLGVLSLLLGNTTTSCADKKEQAPPEIEEHGYVGIRAMPKTQEEAATNWVPGLSEMGTYAEELKPNSFAAIHTDVVGIDRVVGSDYRGNFQTKKCFFEHYLPFDTDWIDMNPKTSPLIQDIQRCEASGWEVEHILICREAELVGQGKWGPFEEDSRILFQRDVDDCRELFKLAYKEGLVKHDNYKLIQLVTRASFFMENPDAAKIIKTMDGVAYESHQFNRHWPYETGWTRPDELAKGAKWVLDQGLEYVFYYGPFVYKEYDQYYDFVERDWLYRFWKDGLPKRHKNMHYYLNCFPHAHGASRKVGPESDPNSYLGMLDWLINEIHGEEPEK